MEIRNSVILLSFAVLLSRISALPSSSEANDADKSKRRDSVISGNPEDGKSINKEDNQSLKDKEATEEPPSYLRIAPACALVFIFVGGSISIFVWEKRKERKKEQADIDAMEDAELSNEWIEHLRNRQRRKSVFQRVRAKSWNAPRRQSDEPLIDREKARKYKIYDEMLEKYWQTLDVLRKGARNAPKEDGSKRAARLKELAQLHQAKSTNDTQKDLEKSAQPPAIDQYSLMLQEAAAAKAEEHIDEEEPIIDPVKIHQRRRSSRFHKQANIEDEETANQGSSLQEATGLSQSYLASHEHIPSMQDIASGNQRSLDESLHDALANITPREMSALHRLQVKMRPKSLIENLAAIHRESEAMAASMSALPTSGLYENPAFGSSKTSLPSLGISAGMGRKRVIERGPEPPLDDMKTLGVTPRGNQRMRSRPKSLYETGAAKRKISQKKFRSRPSSMYIPHTIEEDKAHGVVGKDKPTVQVIDIDSLQNLDDYALSAADEDHVMAKLEQQLIADVCQENELSREEIRALENLLEDVVSYSKENLAEPKKKITKQYSFTDSVSLFDGIEEDREEDKTEETVLLSLAGAAASKQGKRSSLSTYDND